MCWGTCSSSTRDTRSLKATACSSGPGWSSIWQQPGESGGRAAVSVAMVLGLLEFGVETRRGAIRKPASRKTMPGFKSGSLADQEGVRHLPEPEPGRTVFEDLDELAVLLARGLEDGTLGRTCISIITCFLASFSRYSPGENRYPPR